MSSAFRTDCRRHSFVVDRLLVATLLIATLMTVFAARAAEARAIVKLDGFDPGTIVIKAGQRRLFFVMRGGEAVQYPVAVGKPGFAWTGRAHIEGKFVRPAWAPPAIVKRGHPLAAQVHRRRIAEEPDGGSRADPRPRRDRHPRHQRADAPTVGTAVSYGCIRMYDEDVIDLYRRVRVGTTVVMLQ